MYKVNKVAKKDILSTFCVMQIYVLLFINKRKI